MCEPRRGINGDDDDDDEMTGKISKGRFKYEVEAHKRE